LVGIGAEGREIAGEIGRDLYPGGTGAITDKIERGADGLVQIDRLFLGATLPGHGEEAFDNAAAALGRGADSRGALGQLAAPVLLQHRRLADDDRQRVVELVCHPGEQRAERAHFLALVQPVTLAGDLARRLLLLRQIPDCAVKSWRPPTRVGVIVSSAFASLSLE
jgi:hypothetical protein